MISKTMTPDVGMALFNVITIESSISFLHNNNSNNGVLMLLIYHSSVKIRYPIMNWFVTLNSYIIENIIINISKLYDHDKVLLFLLF